MKDTKKDGFAQTEAAEIHGGLSIINMLYFQLLSELVFLTQSLISKPFMLIVKQNFPV